MDEQVKMGDSSLPSNHYVIIDNLTVLLRRQGLSTVATLLHTLPGSKLSSELSTLWGWNNTSVIILGRGSVGCLVSCLHGDLHSSSELQCLEQMVSTVIHLDKSPVPGKQLCTITHLKKSGKVIRKVQLIFVLKPVTSFYFKWMQVTAIIKSKKYGSCQNDVLQSCLVNSCPILQVRLKIFSFGKLK